VPTYEERILTVKQIRDYLDIKIDESRLRQGKYISELTGSNPFMEMGVETALTTVKYDLSWVVGYDFPN